MSSVRNLTPAVNLDWGRYLAGGTVYVEEDFTATTSGNISANNLTTDELGGGWIDSNGYTTFEYQTDGSGLMCVATTANRTAVVETNGREDVIVEASVVIERGTAESRWQGVVLRHNGGGAGDGISAGFVGDTTDVNFRINDGNLGGGTEILRIDLGTLFGDLGGEDPVLDGDTVQFLVSCIGDVITLEYMAVGRLGNVYPNLSVTLTGATATAHGAGSGADHYGITSNDRGATGDERFTSFIVRDASKLTALDVPIVGCKISRRTSPEPGRLPVASTAVVDLIDDGTLTFSSDDTGTLYPGRPIQITANELDTTSTVRWSGFIESIERNRNAAGTVESVRVTANDELRRIVTQELPNAVDFGDPSGSTGDRLHFVTSWALGIPGLRNGSQHLYGTGDATVNELDLGGSTVKTIGTIMAQTVADEAGWLYIDAAGYWQLINRDATWTATDTLGDRPTDSIRYESATVSYDADQTFNTFKLTSRETGNPTTVRTDSASVARVGVRSWSPPQRVPLAAASTGFADADVTNPGDFQAAANQYIRELTEATAVGGLELNAARSDDVAACMAGVDLYDTVDVVATFAEETITQTSRVVGISESWTAGNPWRQRLTLQAVPDVTPFDVESDIDWAALFWADGTNMSATADAANVATWHDESGNGFNVTRTADSDITYDTTGFGTNDRARVVFTGAQSSHLTNTTGSMLQENANYIGDNEGGTITWVCIYTLGQEGSDGDNSVHYFVEVASGATGSYRFGWDDDSTGWATDSMNTAYSKGGGSTNTSTGTALDNINGLPGPATVRIRYLNSDDVNGSLDVWTSGGTATAGYTNTWSNASFSGDTYTGDLVVGGRAIGTTGHVGDIAFLGIYQGDLGNHEKFGDLQAWVQSYYGLTLY